ncbi:MAG TPA: LytR C-terminal domain-containing protein [Candidatus Woesebacteria bacterium]|nr:LytR C-terminal domain-containing protein [Candidatus Woesebacteria bacterium]
MKKHSRRINRIAWLIFGGLILLLALAFLENDFKWDGKRDMRIGIITDENLAVLVISPERRMINRVETSARTPIFIGRGYGWYEADKVKKLLIQEKKPTLAEEIFFYNFGIIPDKIEWQDRGVTPESLGLLGFFRLRLNEANYLRNKEILGENREENEALLDEVAVRDLADSNLLQANIKVTVYNGSEVSGLAAFLGKRLDWFGFTVIGTDNSPDKDDDYCRINASEKIRIDLPWNCDLTIDKSLNIDEIEIYFGEKFAEMLQYQ